MQPLRGRSWGRKVDRKKSAGSGGTGHGAGRTRAGCRLLGRNARRDRGDDRRGHLELGVAVLDAVALGDPAEIVVDGPHLARRVLVDEQAHWPVEPRLGVRGHELGPERRVAEDEQRRRAQCDAGVGGELRLVDRHEEHDALRGDVGLEARDRLVERVGALDLDQAVLGHGDVAGARRGRRAERER